MLRKSDIRGTPRKEGSSSLVSDSLFLLSLEARYVLKHGPDGGLLAPASAMPANHSIPQSEGSMDQKHNTMAEKSHNEHVV